MPVFSHNNRFHHGWSAEGEALMDYLERSARPAAARVRDLLEDWFERYPAANRASLRGRLRSTRDKDQKGAFWELYLHEVFRRGGWHVVVAPEGSTDPDFLVSDGEREYFIEASIAGPPGAEVGAAKRKADLRNVLDGTQVGEWSLNLQVDAIGPQAAPARRIRGMIEAALRGRSLVASTNEWLDLVSYVRDGWEIHIRAYPDHPGPGVGAIVSDGPHELPELRAHLALGREIDQKAHKYRGLDKPLLLAVNLDETPLFSAHEIAERALFGNQGLRVTFSGSTPGHREHFRAKDGAWWAPQQRSAYGVWGVLVGPGVGPVSLKSTVPTIWANPHVLRSPLPLSGPIPIGHRWVGDDGRLQQTAPGDLQALLALDDSYPYTSNGD